MKRIPWITRIFARVLLAPMLFAALPVLPLFTVSAPAAGEAVVISSGVSLTLPGGISATTLMDGSYNSYQLLEQGTSIRINSETPFSHMYIIWDLPPPPWRLSTNKETVTLGQNGFLHEVVTLGSPASEAVLQLDGAGYTLCEIVPFAGGSLPQWVQQWQPPLEKADLLVLPTHADDEYIFFGGVLPTYAGEQKLAVQVVYLTNHLQTDRRRPHELLNGLWEVGVGAYPVMGPFPDVYDTLASMEAAESIFGRDEVLAFQVETLRRFSPSVVVAHDLQGEYGHGAHRLNANTLLDALTFAADETSFPESAAKHGTWNTPKAYLHLYEENRLVMDWSQPLAVFGGKTAHEMAVAGFANHLSQTSFYSVNQASLAESGSVYENRTFGLAYTTVGLDEEKNDLFENIDLTPLPPPAPLPDSVTPSSVPEPVPQPVASVSRPASVSQPPVAESGTPWVTPVVFCAAVLVVLFAVIFAVLRRRKK